MNENVLLELTEEFTETKIASGIIIPDSSEGKPQMARVVALGNIENPGVSQVMWLFTRSFQGLK